MTNINIYSWLSHSMVHIPSPDDPNHICLFLCFVNREVAQSCPTLCYPMDCSLPGSSVHGILQVRVLEWVTISFSMGSSQSRDRTQISCMCLEGKKNGSDHPVGAEKKKIHFKEALGFIGILSQFKCPENQRQFPYQNFIDGANGEAKVKVFLSRSVLSTFNVHTVTWRSC